MHDKKIYYTRIIKIKNFTTNITKGFKKSLEALIYKALRAVVYF